MRVWRMRTGISFSVTLSDRRRLRIWSKIDAPQKRVWRARIVLLSAEGVGRNAIMRETGKSKTCVWRWQERFAAEGFEAFCATRRSARWFLYALFVETKAAEIAPASLKLCERLRFVRAEQSPPFVRLEWRG
jgi:hypothetical protein